jgi:DNA-binding transcriptional regulator YdaS (Cro superfamily)
MDIPAYLHKHGLSQADFATMLDVSPGLVWQWINEYTQITAERAKEIEEKTRGEITRHDLRPDLYEKRARVA